MEPLASFILWVLNLDRIPWNMSFQFFMKIIPIFAEWINFRKLISTLYKLAHPKFHVIPCNSMEFHGTACVSEIGALQTLSSMAFHGIPRNCSCQRNWCTPHSIEFHEISRNCSGHRNWRTPSSMEFHGMPWYCSGQRNWRTLSSMEFHGTARVIEIGELRVPWNSFFFVI